MKLFKELPKVKQDEVINKHYNRGPLFSVAVDNVRKVLMESKIHYFDSNLGMHIHYGDENTND